MFDPALSNFKKMDETLELCELPEDLTLLGRENILRRREVIRNENDPIPMKNFISPDLFESLDGKGRRDVIAQGKVDSDIEKFTRGNSFLPRIGCENLLRDRHRLFYFHILV